MPKTTTLLAIAVLVFLMIFAGCTQNGLDKPQTNTGKKNGNQADEVTAYPREVMQALEVVRPLKVGTSVICDGQTFIIASFGEQPTAGYKVKITGIEKEDDQVTVRVKLKAPEGPAAEVITYPYTVKVIEGRHENVQFIAQDEYMPQIVGLQEPLKAPRYSSDNIMVLNYEPAGIKASGIARVFEATLNYELRDVNGNVLGNGYIQTASGGPDWGYFQLNLDREKLPGDTSELVLFQSSPKDGSLQDEIHLPVITK